MTSVLYIFRRFQCMTLVMKTVINSPASRVGVTLMVVCAAFFVWDVSVDVYEHLTNGITYTNSQIVHTVFELVVVVGLGYGIYTVWMVRRLMAERAQSQEDTITLLRGSFDKVIHQRFEDWALTGAERDITIYILKGMSTADIAMARGVSLGTIKNQTTAVFRKIGVSSRNELMSVFMDEFLDGASENTSEGSPIE